MGANSRQGWFLFIFLVGFTFFVAGLAYLGMLAALLGLVALIASVVGFKTIKPLEYGQEENTPQPAGSSSARRRAS